MKKFLALTLAVVMALLLVACASNSAGGSSEPPIAFGKRYLEHDREGSKLTNERVYIFNANGTGYYEFDYMRPTISINNPYAPCKGKIDFVWRALSDGTVCLFATETTYYEGHSEGGKVTLQKVPLIFGEDVLFEMKTDGGVTYFVAENSSLADSLTT